MFDRPGLILMASVATFGPLSALWLVRWMNKFEAPEGVYAFLSSLTLIVCDLYVGMIISAFIARMYEEYKDSRPDTPAPQRTEWKAPIFVEGKQLNALTVVKVKFDARRHFAFTIDRQIEHGYKVDLTEDFWLKRYIDPKHPEMGKKPKRWKGTPNEFRQCKHDWLELGIFDLEDPSREKSPYCVRNRDMLKRAANGALPH